MYFVDEVSNFKNIIKEDNKDSKTRFIVLERSGHGNLLQSLKDRNSNKDKGNINLFIPSGYK